MNSKSFAILYYAPNNDFRFDSLHTFTGIAFRTHTIEIQYRGSVSLHIIIIQIEHYPLYCDLSQNLFFLIKNNYYKNLKKVSTCESHYFYILLGNGLLENSLTQLIVNDLEYGFICWLRLQIEPELLVWLSPHSLHYKYIQHTIKGKMTMLISLSLSKIDYQTVVIYWTFCAHLKCQYN